MLSWITSLIFISVLSFIIKPLWNCHPCSPAKHIGTTHHAICSSKYLNPIVFVLSPKTRTKTRIVSSKSASLKFSRIYIHTSTQRKIYEIACINRWEPTQQIANQFSFPLFVGPAFVHQQFIQKMTFQNQKLAAIFFIWVTVASMVLAVSAEVSSPASPPSAAPSSLTTAFPVWMLIGFLGFIIYLF